MRTVYFTPAGIGCWRTRELEAGQCKRCGRELRYRHQQNKYYCPSRTRDPLWRFQNKAAGRTHWAPECFEWLGRKIGMAPDDPRLPEVALQLAEAEKLLALVSQKGSIVALAKAPDPA